MPSESKHRELKTLSRREYRQLKSRFEACDAEFNRQAVCGGLFFLICLCLGAALTGRFPVPVWVERGLTIAYAGSIFLAFLGWFHFFARRVGRKHHLLCAQCGMPFRKLFPLKIPPDHPDYHVDGEVPLRCPYCHAPIGVATEVDVRQKVLKRLEAEGVLPQGNRGGGFRPADRHALKIFEYYEGFHCVHLRLGDEHRPESFLLSPDGNLKPATLARAARLVEHAKGRPNTTSEAVGFLREVLRVLPYESEVIESVREIPLPQFGQLDEEDAERERKKWRAFVEGVGQSIAPPEREDVGGDQTYTVFIYQKIGGEVICYQVRWRAGQAQIHEETIAKEVGDCRLIR